MTGGQPGSPFQGGTFDLSEFKVNVKTGNNGAHQRSPYDPGIQKWPFFFVQTPEFYFYLYEAHDVACK